MIKQNLGRRPPPVAHLMLNRAGFPEGRLVCVLRRHGGDLKVGFSMRLRPQREAQGGNPLGLDELGREPEHHQFPAV